MLMDVFEAIAEPNRRKILGLLQQSELPAGAVVDAMGMSQPGVSKHLKLLREAGLVSVRADGQRRLYRVEPDRLAELDAWLAPYRRYWRDKLDALEDHLMRES
jgi:DNA-binding transcriptional ArsR family regulator